MVAAGSFQVNESFAAAWADSSQPDDSWVRVVAGDEAQSMWLVCEVKSGAESQPCAAAIAGVSSSGTADSHSESQSGSYIGELGAAGCGSATGAAGAGDAMEGCWA